MLKMEILFENHFLGVWGRADQRPAGSKSCRNKFEV